MFTSAVHVLTAASLALLVVYCITAMSYGGQGTSAAFWNPPLFDLQSSICPSNLADTPPYRARIWYAPTQSGEEIVHPYLEMETSIYKRLRTNGNLQTQVVSDIREPGQALNCSNGVLLNSSPDDWIKYIGEFRRNYYLDRRFIRNNFHWARRHKVCQINVDSPCVSASPYFNPPVNKEWGPQIQRYTQRWFAVREFMRQANSWVSAPDWVWHADTDVIVANKHRSLKDVKSALDVMARAGGAMINPEIRPSAGIDEFAIVASVDMSLWKEIFFINGGSLQIRNFKTSPVAAFFVESLIALSNYTTFDPPSRFEPGDQGNMSWLAEVAFNINRTDLSLTEWYKFNGTRIIDPKWYTPWHETCIENKRFIAIGEFDYDAASKIPALQGPLQATIPDRSALENTPRLMAIACPRMLDSYLGYIASGRSLVHKFPDEYRELMTFNCSDFAAHYIGGHKWEAFSATGAQKKWKECSDFLPSPADILL